jgi:hypothetical protein
MAMVKAVRPLVVVRGPQVFDCKRPMKRSIISTTRAKRRQSLTFSSIWNLAVRFLETKRTSMLVVAIINVNCTLKPVYKPVWH